MHRGSNIVSFRLLCSFRMVAALRFQKFSLSLSFLPDQLTMEGHWTLFQILVNILNCGNSEVELQIKFGFNKASLPLSVSKLPLATGRFTRHDHRLPGLAASRQQITCYVCYVIRFHLHIMMYDSN